jgi:hypothetical protein
MNKNNCQNCQNRIIKTVDKQYFMICLKDNHSIENIIKEKCENHKEIENINYSIEDLK